MKYARANPSTAQTNAALIVATPTQRVVIDEIYVSSDAELTVTLVNSETHDVLWRQYVGARGGVWLRDLSFWSAVGEGIDYTTSATGNVYLAVGYHVLGRSGTVE